MSERSAYHYRPHPHVQRRKHRGPVRQEHYRGQGFNAWLGLRITLVVGTMWAAYAFTLLALISAPAAFASGDKLVIVAWIAQTFLQLVLLPVIIVGQNIQAKAADARADQTYSDAEAVLHEVLEIQRHLTAQDEQLASQCQRLTKLHTELERRVRPDRGPPHDRPGPLRALRSPPPGW